MTREKCEQADAWKAQMRATLIEMLDLSQELIGPPLPPTVDCRHMDGGENCPPECLIIYGEMFHLKPITDEQIENLIEEGYR